MKSKSKWFRGDLLPLLLLVTLQPLISVGCKVAVSLGQYSWFPDGEFQYDFFMYGKSIAFLALVLWMLVMLTDRVLIRGKKLHHGKYFIPLYIYAILVVLSTVLSADKTLSLKGMWQQYESVWVLLGYVVTVFYSVQVIESMEDVKVILYALLCGAACQGMIGLSQFAGKDFFASALGKVLMTLGLGSYAKDNLQFLYAGNGSSTVYMAAYTPNYAGVYLAMVLPVVFLFAIKEKNRIRKITEIVLCVILAVCLYGSGSKTGILVCGILLLAAAFMFCIKKIRGNQKWICAGICLVLLCVGIKGYDMAQNQALSDGLKSMTEKEQYDLQAMEPGDTGVTLQYKGHELELVPELTEWGQMLQGIEDGKTTLTANWDDTTESFRFQDTLYSELAFDTYTQGNVQYITVQYLDVDWIFYKEDYAEKYVFLNQYQKADEIKNAPAVLKGHEKMLSGRGYIWGRTIPLLKKCILWGSGPDTFAAVFPQSDYVMKANTGLGMYQQLPTKAHSMYLQTALQTGILSLICLLIFWGQYLFLWIRNHKKEKKGWLRLVILAAVVSFWLMGLLNDSNLAVSPVFWCLLGMGYAVETGL
ncbi:O-antigen ligase family protein [Blautia sp. MSJ-19]|uniref:O-antigen ligase family protein n=1 Tax=Blautia sp. MSJ-19 TaxID=2841517 RepID=UPI001C0F09DA|nr:O-antigen ligase family protein [Blautia sp. MSJ-19]MBU5480128.1 O-antigen ligase family protein [Blautia sp. MSJ-19]